MSRNPPVRIPKYGIAHDIHKQLKYIPGFEGDTYKWWQDRQQMHSRRTSSAFDPERRA